MIFDFWRVTPNKRSVRLNRKKGVLFYNPSIIGKTIFFAGSWMIILSSLFLVYLLYPTGKAYFTYYYSFKSKDDNQKKDILIKANQNIIKETPKVVNFEILIPKIGAKTQIMANISPYNEEEYIKVLEKGVVAQSSISNLPGSGLGKMTYIFAHSSNQGIVAARNNPVFYLLGELSTGDSVWIERNGTKYLYTVYDKKIVGAHEIKYLNYFEPDKEILILQTCWPIGTDWNRLLVFAQLSAF